MNDKSLSFTKSYEGSNLIYHFNIAGKYIEVEPLGIHHCVFMESGNHYTWRKVKTVVHNIVIGKLWVDQGRRTSFSTNLSTSLKQFKLKMK